MNKGMFTSNKDDWETPQDLFDKLNQEFHFNLDVCALPENAKCKKYFTPDQNGLKQDWAGRIWCNPPYGRKISAWASKALYQTICGIPEIIVMLLPARTDTKWFHNYIYDRSEIRFIKGRLRFGGSKNNAPFPSMIVIFRRINNV